LAASVISAAGFLIGVVPANSYRVFLGPDGGIIWDPVMDGQTVRYRDEPRTGFRRRFVANLLKLLSIDSQL
jgi:cardiolipin synthase C